MSRISLSSLRRVSREDLQGAPDWVDPLLTASNEFQEQATAALERPLLTGVLDTYDFVHGVEQIIKSPLGVMPSGVSDVRCRGVTVDSAGKPTGAFYTLGAARLDWRPVQSRPGEPIRVGVTAYFAPTSTSGYVGERVVSYVTTGAPVTIAATATAQDVTSISLTPGSWDVTGELGFLVATGGAWTYAAGSVNDTSATISTLYADRSVEVGSPVLGVTSYVTIASVRFDVTTTTTIYLVAREDFAGGPAVHYAFGRLSAVRAKEYSTGLRGRVTLRFDGGN